jgi:hypothetical protein
MQQSIFELLLDDTLLQVMDMRKGQKVILNNILPLSCYEPNFVMKFAITALKFKSKRMSLNQILLM